jgi:hypothetical protein
MTNFLVSTFDLFDNIDLPFTIPDDPVIDALGDMVGSMISDNIWVNVDLFNGKVRQK